MPLLTHTSAGDTQTLKGSSVSVFVESPGMHKVLYELSEHFWWVWGLILNMISLLLPSCWSFSFALGCGVYFLVGSLGFSVHKICLSPLSISGGMGFDFM